MKYKYSDHTSQETHYVSPTKPNWLMLFRETVAVYCENRTEHTDTLPYSFKSPKWVIPFTFLDFTHLYSVNSGEDDMYTVLQF
jgi:hypothetical protein